jgi:uncharacterized protein (TIGR02452 family)
MSLVKIGRGFAITLGNEAVAIARAGHYRGADGRAVHIQKAVQSARNGTVSYPPHQQLTLPPARFAETRFEVENDVTLSVAGRLVKAGHRVAALNFASATDPGGGFLDGACAQEESLCRSSALYECIKDSEMYAWHHAHPDPLYGHWVLYSPDVPVFRGCDHKLLEEPFNVSFLTSPAVMAKEVIRYDASRRHEIASAMGERIHRVLTVAAMHGHHTLVLGAWGCGAFGNDPEVIAELFHAALDGAFRGQFEMVIFGVLDEWSDRRNIGTFERRFNAS